MIEITTDTYRMIASRLKEEIAVAEWFNGSVGGETSLSAFGGAAGSTTGGFVAEDRAVRQVVEWRLTLSAIIYRRTETLPEGLRRPVFDVVPVWWEFLTATDNGPVPNDFSFTEFKPYLADYD